MSLRILHVLFGYYPDPLGGTEVYVEALARYQHEAGMVVCIAAPADADANYQHQGLEVFRYELNPVDDLEDIYGEGDVRGAEALERIAKNFKADVVHFHAFTRGVSLLAAKKIRAIGAALVLTYHTPTVSCSRGTMMRFGEQPCTGNLQCEPCTACTLNSKGIHSTFAKRLAALPIALSQSGKYLPENSFTTALRMPALLKLRESSVLELLKLADHWVGVCDWVCDVLRINGVEPARLSLSRQGVARRLPKREKIMRDASSPIRAVMLGRLDIAKGWHIVLEALKREPDLAISIDAYAVNQASASDYENQLKKLSQNEVRFNWCDPLTSEHMLSRLADYDLLLVPSQWLETGPLVVLEAFEAGVPVMGSALGGIAELIEHEKTGYLVMPYDDATAWSAAFKKLSANKNTLNVWANNIKAPRDMTEACQDMNSVYQSALAHRAGKNYQ